MIPPIALGSLGVRPFTEGLDMLPLDGLCCSRAPLLSTGQRGPDMFYSSMQMDERWEVISDVIRTVCKWP